jgi:F-type H+-transporting ATPase subunit b
MEIFHAFGIEWKLLVIQMINFAVVVFVLHRYAYKPIISLLEERRGVIAKSLQDAEEVKKEKAALVNEKNTTLAQAREEGAEIVAQLRKSGDEKVRETLKDADEKAAAILIHAQHKAEEEKAFLMRESEKEIAKMVVLGIEKVLREQKSS